MSNISENKFVDNGSLGLASPLRFVGNRFVRDSIVAKALDFIKSNVGKQIQVLDVVEHVSVSRRELERRFKKTLDRSIHHEIKLARVELIRKMLVETTDNISEIAVKLDFSSVGHIGRYFKDVYGISPAEYRKKNLCLTE